LSLAASAIAQSKSPEATIADDYNSGDPAKYAEGAKLLEQILTEAPRKVRRDMQARWLKPLLRAKAYDQVEHIAIPGILSGPEDTVGVSGVQNARVQAFLAAGQYEEALGAAKAYFNVCQLEETAGAMELMVQALSNTRGKQDETIVRRFKLQQVARAKSGPTTKPAPAEENILTTIKVDGSLWESKIESLQGASVSYVSLTGLGNLLLLADRPAEARKAFEHAVDLADSKTITAAVANVARALRAEHGSIGPANAYIVALRQPGGSTPATTNQ
jgi:hypothetical protein